MISTAVILAAGMGSRLGEWTKDSPKGFLDFKGEALIVRSINRMKKAGISRIFVGVGYLADSFKRLEFFFPEVSFIFFENKKYASTGSMSTLYCGRNLIDDDFLLFESDLLYEPYALTCLLNDPRDTVVLASGFTGSGDEVWIEKDTDDVLLGMSKQKEDLTEIHGELVGITMISLATARLLFDFIEPYLAKNPAMDYESALVLLSSRDKNIYVKIVDDLAWCEIDNEDHLKRALENVFPKIKANELLRR